MVTKASQRFLQIPGSGDLFSYFVDFDTRRLEPWEKIIPSFKYSADVPYFDLLVPTVDTVRYGFMMEKLLTVNRSVMFTGTTGVGKVRFNTFNYLVQPIKQNWRNVRERTTLYKIYP